MLRGQPGTDFDRAAALGLIVAVAFLVARWWR